MARATGSFCRRGGRSCFEGFYCRHSHCLKHIAFARAAQRKRSRMGEGGRRPDEGPSLVPVFQRHQYRVTHRIPRREHVGVPHAQHPPALLFQKPRTRCIIPHFSFAPVRCAINLNNQRGSTAGKVCEIAQLVKIKKLTQAKAATLTGTAQPDLSNLLRGRFRSFSIERLMLMLTAFGRDVEVVVRPAPRSRKQGGTRFKSVEV